MHVGFGVWKIAKGNGIECEPSGFFWISFPRLVSLYRDALGQIRLRLFSVLDATLHTLFYHLAVILVIHPGPSRDL